MEPPEKTTDRYFTRLHIIFSHAQNMPCKHRIIEEKNCLVFQRSQTACTILGAMKMLFYVYRLHTNIAT